MYETLFYLSLAANLIQIAVLVYRIKITEYIDKEQRDHKKRMEKYKQSNTGHH